MLFWPYRPAQLIDDTIGYVSDHVVLLSVLCEGFGPTAAAGSLFGNKTAAGGLGTGLGASFGAGMNRTDDTSRAQ